MTDISSTVDPLSQAAHEWHLRLSDPEVSKETRDAFDAWLQQAPHHAAAFALADNTIEAISNMNPDALDAELHRPLIRERLGAWWVSTGSHTSARRWLAGAMVTGCAVLAVVFSVSWLRGSPDTEITVTVSDFTAPVGATERFALMDGSTVLLGADSVLEVRMGPEIREADLVRGAALFDVLPDAHRPFVVRSTDLVVRVVGTRFDVRSNGGITRVAVADGTVGVRLADGAADGGASLRVTAGQQVSATNAVLAKITEVDPASVGAWQSGRLVYRQAPLSELIADANRYFEGSITIDDPTGSLQLQTVSATFDGANIQRMLDMLPRILPVTVHTVAPEQIVLRPQAPSGRN
ncbi:MAG: FecR domain-containing protein [Pseudomonadota bacterium]